MKHTVNELFKLIGELTGYGHSSTSITITYNPARMYNGFGESEGVDLKDWGFAVSTKLCRMDDVKVSAQGKELDEALWELAQAIPTKLEEMHQRQSTTVFAARAALTKFIEKDKPEAPPATGSPYR